MGGYAWPRLAIWGEGNRIGLSSRSDPAGVVGPVRYLTDALIYVPALAFETETDRFLKLVSEEGSGLASDWAALCAQIEALIAERTDPEVSAWRRLEAQLGYDVDEAPEALINDLHKLEQAYGIEAVAEAALATQGEKSADVLKAEIAAANEHHWQCDLHRIALLVGRIDKDSGEPPWRLGERAAKKVRAATGHQTGPLPNKPLTEILSVRSEALKSHKTRNRAYGLRMNTERQRGEVVAPSSGWSADRRFEFSRALGDAIWSENEPLGPLTRTKSERQKFQRAFAQSLLCPFKALQDYIGDDTSDGALTAAAKHFYVSERVVRTLLVNERVLQRDRLEPSTAEFDDDELEAA
jgi:hypothetical protein